MQPESKRFTSILKLEIKRTSVYTLSGCVTQLGAFLIVPLFWRELSPADYGMIAVTEMIGVILTVFSGLALEQSITRFYYEWQEEERRRKVGAIWIANWMSTIACGAAGVLVLSIVSPVLFPDVAFYPFIFLGVISSIFNGFYAVPVSTIRMEKLPTLYFFSSVFRFAVSMGFSCYFVLILHHGLYGYYIAAVLAGAVNAALIGAIMLKFAQPCIRGGDLRKLLAFSLPIIPSQIVSGISSILDRFLLQQFLSLEILGIYAICLKFTNLITVLHGALKLSYVPFMVEAVSRDREKGVIDVARMGLFYVVPILILGLTISAYIKEFVSFANRSEYFPVVHLVPWLIAPAILQTLNLYFTPGLFLSKRTDLMWVPATIQLVISFVGALILIPLYQLDGVIISRYLSATVFVAIAFILTQKYYPFPAKWGRFFTLFILMAIGIGITNRLSTGTIYLDVFLKGLIIAGFSFICIWFSMDAAGVWLNTKTRTAVDVGGRSIQE